jgi:carotenoid cleavage dioxygenase
MMHDFNVTSRHVIFMDLPVVFDLEAAIRGEMPYAWSDAYGARLGVMPRDGNDADCTWYEIDPCYVFHPLNAWEEDGQITIDVCRFPELWRRAGEFEGQAPPTLHRWVIDAAAGKVREEQLDDVPCDFPRVADDRVGLRARYGYATATGGDLAAGTGAFPGRLLKYDLAAGTSEVHDFGAGRHPGEGVFVADPDGSAEDDGWVLAWVYDEDRDTSEVSILDSRDFAGAPVATIELPRRVPYGFHGSFLPA